MRFAHCYLPQRRRRARELRGAVLLDTALLALTDEDGRGTRAAVRCRTHMDVQAALLPAVLRAGIKAGQAVSVSTTVRAVATSSPSPISMLHARGAGCQPTSVRISSRYLVLSWCGHSIYCAAQVYRITGRTFAHHQALVAPLPQRIWCRDISA